MTKKLLLVGMMSALAMVGCSSKTTKPESKKPVKLVEIDRPMAVLSPVFYADLSRVGLFSRQDKLHKKDIPDLQVAIDDTHLLGASALGVVEAYERGSRVWSIHVGEPIVSGVAYDKASQIAIVGTRSGRIVALDAQTGSIRWEQKLKATTLAPALIAGNRVLLSANDGIVYGLNLQNGSQIWQFSTQNPNISMRGTAKPLRLDGSTALFGTADGRIHALLIDQGKPLWTRRIGVSLGGNDASRMSDVDGMPLVVDSHLYVTSVSGSLMGFDMSTGRTLFTVRDFASTVSVAHQDGVLIGVDTEGMMHGFHAQTGVRLWENNALKFRKPTSPVAIGRFVAVGDLEGVVHLFTKEGNLVGRTVIKGKDPIVSLVAHGNRLSAQTATGGIAVWQVQ